MSGVEFERFALAHFKRKGYGAKETPKQSDYGGDLVLQKDGRTVVVQAKRWDGVVGVKAVQEVLGAINYYDAQKGIVLTNSDFTENAYELAKKSPVELWNRQKLTQDLMATGGRPDDEITSISSSLPPWILHLPIPSCAHNWSNNQGPPKDRALRMWTSPYATICRLRSCQPNIEKRIHYQTHTWSLGPAGSRVSTMW